MVYDDLSSLITALEYGTNLHISVHFRGGWGNDKTRLPFPQRIHHCPVCDIAKSTPERFAACFRCRNTVLEWILRHKRSFGGLCTKGVYEYCRPVVLGDAVAAIIFVGNILPADTSRLLKHVDEGLLSTMQADFSPEDCQRTADLLESYILLLLEKYGQTTQHSADLLTENMKSYIQENLLYDFSMADMAAAFSYNEKYLGRLFKAKTGHTVKEYCNLARVEKAKLLLRSGNAPISAIACQTGYNNVTYFNRIFKRLTGRSPQDFRNT